MEQKADTEAEGPDRLSESRRPSRRPGSHRLRNVLLGLLLLSIVLILGPGRDLVKIGYKTALMKSPKVYQEVANQLAVCCQSKDLIQTDVHRGRKLTAAQYPDVIRELNPSWVQVSPEWANVEMGGGFYHYGYRLKLDNGNSTDAQSHWNLFYYTEKDHNKLFTLVLAKPDGATR